MGTKCAETVVVVVVQPTVGVKACEASHGDWLSNQFASGLETIVSKFNSRSAAYTLTCGRPKVGADL